MRRAVVFPLWAVIALTTLIVLSLGRAGEKPDNTESDSKPKIEYVLKSRCTVATTPYSSDLRMAGAATWFAYAHAADRIDEVADELEAINAERAAALRAVGLQFRSDMHRLEKETGLRDTEEVLTFGSGVLLCR